MANQHWAPEYIVSPYSSLVVQPSATVLRYKLDATHFYCRDYNFPQPVINMDSHKVEEPDGIIQPRSDTRDVKRV